MNGYVDVKDVAKAMFLLMESDITGERFTLNSENLSYKQLFEMMAMALSVPPPKYKAGKFLSGLSWRILKVQSYFTGKSPMITKQTARRLTVFTVTVTKNCEATGIHFIPMKEVLRNSRNLFERQIAISLMSLSSISSAS